MAPAPQFAHLCTSPCCCQGETPTHRVEQRTHREEVAPHRGHEVTGTHTQAPLMPQRKYQLCRHCWILESRHSATSNSYWEAVVLRCPFQSARRRTPEFCKLCQPGGPSSRDAPGFGFPSVASSDAHQQTFVEVKAARVPGEGGEAEAPPGASSSLGWF